MKKYIIIVSVYDYENTQAYPLGFVFKNEDSAKEFIRKNITEVINNHWTKDLVDKEDPYIFGMNPTGWSTCDEDTGQSLEIEIYQLEEES